MVVHILCGGLQSLPPDLPSRPPVLSHLRKRPCCFLPEPWTSYSYSFHCVSFTKTCGVFNQICVRSQKLVRECTGFRSDTQDSGSNLGPDFGEGDNPSLEMGV